MTPQEICVSAPQVVDGVRVGRLEHRGQLGARGIVRHRGDAVRQPSRMADALGAGRRLAAQQPRLGTRTTASDVATPVHPISARRAPGSTPGCSGARTGARSRPERSASALTSRRITNPLSGTMSMRTPRAPSASTTIGPIAATATRARPARSGVLLFLAGGDLPEPIDLRRAGEGDRVDPRRWRAPRSAPITAASSLADA